jgi:hypothetical protein
MLDSSHRVHVVAAVVVVIAAAVDVDGIFCLHAH